MSKALVLGNGPVVLTAQDGHFLEIPLSALIYDSGTIKLASPTLYPPKYQSELIPWIQYLSNAGILSAGAPLVAMVIQAIQSGSMGNTINVTIDNVNTTANTFDMNITETDQYVGLSYDSASSSFCKTILGTNKPVPGTRLGLVVVNDSDTPDLPANNDYSLQGGTTKKPSSVDILKDDKSKAFTLFARAIGDENLTKVTIKDASATTKTFTLIASWTKKITGINLSTPTTYQNYEVEILPAPGLPSPPVSGTNSFPYLPAQGSIQPSGGSDALTGRPAIGTVLAN